MSQLWTPYRALGLVSGEAPFFVERRGTKSFITTPVGSSFHVYDADKLRLVFVGPHNRARNACAVSVKNVVYVGSAHFIVAYRRGKEIARWSVLTESDVPREDLPDALVVSQLHVFGLHLISISTDNVLRVWETHPVRLYAELALPKDEFEVTTMIHPVTYLNKIVLGSRQGALRLYNLRTLQLVHEFAPFSSRVVDDAGEAVAEPSAVLCMAQSPVVDVIAVGCADGSIYVVNLLYDVVLKTYAHESSPVTALAFRNDGPGVLVSGGLGGEITMWSLDHDRIVASVPYTHSSPVTCIKFLEGEPLMLTSGRDNKLSMWVFDQPDGSPRLLRSRSGFARPPHLVRFHGGDARHLLAASEDRSLRFISTINDAQSREISQGSLASKAAKTGRTVEDLRIKTVTALASASIKERKWDSILTTHAGVGAAFTWSFFHKRIGKHKLKVNTTGPRHESSAVTISVCGHYGVVGTSTGLVARFNMQSGARRGDFSDPSLDGKAAHTKRVTGLAIDAVNLLLISTSLDGTVKFWSFAKGELLDTIALDSPIVKASIHRDSGFLALASDDLTLRIVDIETRRVVRSFEGHYNQITDLCISPDARWLISSSMDSTLRVWDLPTGRAVDWVRFDRAVTSLDMSPDSAYLATTHVNSQGIFLWANAHHFSSARLVPVDESLTPGQLPLVQVNTSLLGIDSDATESGESYMGARSLMTLIKDQEAAADAAATKNGSGAGSAAASGSEPGAPGDAQLDPRLVTLSSLPASRWTNLVRMDEVRERNRASDDHLVLPEKAPFFLATKAGLEPEFDTSVIDEMKAEAEAVRNTAKSSRILDLGSLKSTSGLYKHIASRNFDAALAWITKSSPARVDLELRTMSDPDDLVAVVQFLTWGLSTLANYELFHSLAQLVLTVHQETLLAGEAGLDAELVALQAAMADPLDTLDAMFNASLCMVKHVRGIQ
ncbi:Wd-repeat protein [Thecamonas trahens ATCC 50062]|uniref:Wd-repeat protein n=1 Tax=Thecamonas trahens ATCC 50062 TaxID=461836 RepID=A0A0L0DAD6_THETB|nr:Wd-repeat protein [Thecamonas trahens ATCC 50062]KNC48258.1 Wd-repeat protein [Thecamonas trahens ATCC 50062]|eukprot:XP_013758827.1 Wd-repeat protein [Thecamonas trahens ATCC 50062]